jgi:hypothetical protein
MISQKLFGIEPGLIKICFPSGDNPQEELALITSGILAAYAELPNNALCYEYFLRDGMKTAVHEIGKGFKVNGAFAGSKIDDKHIEDVNGRTIQLNSSFSESNNFHYPLISCNNSYFENAINEIKIALYEAGFDVDNSTWDDYKVWQPEKLKSF